jgi:mannose-6-phosphate isomerase-like protein (cupin superfamily)
LTTASSDESLAKNRGKSYVGRIDDHAKRKGWFFGAFVDEPLLKSDLVEVAWQHLPNVTPSEDQTHFHRHTVEINVVISGWIALAIDGSRHRLERGEFYIVWPESVVSDLSTGPDTELLVVRAPSKPGDKVSGRPGDE